MKNLNLSLILPLLVMLLPAAPVQGSIINLWPPGADAPVASSGQERIGNPVFDRINAPGGNGFLDGGFGQLWVMTGQEQTFGGPNHTSTWGGFQHSGSINNWLFHGSPDSAGRDITPLLILRIPAGPNNEDSRTTSLPPNDQPAFFQSLDEWVITGIGTPRTNPGNDIVNNVPFGLVEGSAQVSAGEHFFGWWNGFYDGTTNPDRGQGVLTTLEAQGGVGGGEAIFFGGAPAIGPTLGYELNQKDQWDGTEDYLLQGDIMPRLYSVRAFVDIGVVPEPGTFALFMLGFLGLALSRRVRS